MATILLVHGAWHGAWCWFKIVPRLAALGHRVIAPDLPGLGRDRTDPRGLDLDAYADAVLSRVEADAGPVVLVGHSMGGGVIARACEKAPEKIGLAVYVCAFLVEPGQSILAAAAGDPVTLLAGKLIPGHDGATATVSEDAIVPAFYADCSDEDVALARSLLVPQSSAAFQQKVQLSPERFGQVPRVYVECLDDKAIGIDVQRRMWKATPCREVVTMATGHSPFLSAPDDLAGILDRVSRAV